MKLVAPALMILGVTGITFLVVWFRYSQLAVTSDTSSPSVPPRRLFAFAFTMAAFLFGSVIAVGFYVATGWWQSADRILFWTAVGLTVLFSVGALVVRTQVIKGGAVESIALNLLWGLGYGWVLPSLMRALGAVR